ncbi:hypothetical protein [Marinobacter sp. LN3S78]|uniref:hypothetical protein n=1 Tax=Marinobacter sp. LN3S78 TaxID=3382300 RepID=UPI00387B872D
MARGNIVYRAYHRIYRYLRVRLLVGRLRLGQFRAFHGNEAANLVVSLTSFPARIDDVWITIESIFQQHYKPSRVVLVLAEPEFPGRRLPRSIERQVARGLEILWVPHNTRSYKKLLPVRHKYPDSAIVTLDDDIIYEPWRLGRLGAHSREHPGSIIGFRGREVCLRDVAGFRPYMDWPLATLNTPPYRTLLTGVGGILYPPGVMDGDMLFDMASAQELAPTADDIWFWAVALSSGVPVRCLGYQEHIAIRMNDIENSLQKINCDEGRNDRQLAAVANAYNLWDRLTAGSAAHDVGTGQAQ